MQTKVEKQTSWNTFPCFVFIRDIKTKRYCLIHTCFVSKLLRILPCMFAPSKLMVANELVLKIPDYFTNLKPLILYFHFNQSWWQSHIWLVDQILGQEVKAKFLKVLMSYQNYIWHNNSSATYLKKHQTGTAPLHYTITARFKIKASTTAIATAGEINNIVYALTCTLENIKHRCTHSSVSFGKKFFWLQLFYVKKVNSSPVSGRSGHLTMKLKR